jgi:phosphatidylglycerol:prolipoprotein diacylglycerol transferase
MTETCSGGWPAAYLHLLSPFAVQLTDSFGIRWYGLAYLVGFYLGYLAIRWLGKRERIELPPTMAADFVFTAAIGVLVGGRLGYCIFYNPSHLITFTSELPFWKALAINEGGMASHGGIIGMMLAIWWFARKNKFNYLALIDLTVIGGTIGIFFGRIANFVNGELFGRIAPPCYRFAVKFTSELSGPHGLDPRLSELAAKMGGRAINNGTVIEAARNGNLEAIAALHQALPGRYPSQLFEGILEGLIPFIIIAIVWRVARRPGFIAATFLLIYPIGRFIGEHYRMPDAHIGFQALGLTRGQWLSVAMLVISIFLMYRWRKADAQPHGGWWRSTEDKP